MTKGQRTVAGLLAVIAVTLGPSLIVRGSSAAGAQPMGGACPEDCQAVPDGAVNVPDLLALLSQWGMAGSCDFDGGGAVQVPDLLQLLAAWGDCGPVDPCGLPASGNCCAPNGTPGCDDAGCCNLVCSADPFCCDVTWDIVCAGSAAALCGCPCAGCGNAGCGDCCIANGTPNCDDLFCCDFVCSIDPFCCDVEWDATCANLAGQVCVICQ